MARGFHGFDEDWLKRYGRKAKVQACPPVPPADVECDSCHAPTPKDAPQGIDTPIRIHIHSVRKRLADADGVSGKAAIDGLIVAGVLADDGPQIVSAVTFTQERTGRKD